MILFDFSALMHQSIFSGVSNMNPSVDKTDHYKTEDFITFTKYYILENLFNIQTNFYSYGDMVICLDDHSCPNWRRRIYPKYKISRKTNRDKSKINYNEVFKEIDKIIANLNDLSPWKIVKTPQAEGDDVILTLAKQFAPKEKILIISADKDMLQAQKYGDVKQYSLFTKQYVTNDTKHEDNIDEWVLDHIVLGDTADEIPKVTDDTIFSAEFYHFLDFKGYHINEQQFYNLDDNRREQIKNEFIESDFSHPYLIKTRKTKNNPDGQKMYYPDIFDSPRFGKATLRKKIEEFGSLDKWLDSNILYRQNYDRNKQLVLADYIPTDIYQDILYNYKQAPNEYKQEQFDQFLEDNKISGVKAFMPPNFKQDIKIDNFFDF